MTDSWHAGPELLGRYAIGELSNSGQAAVETHLTSCSRCRADANQVVGGESMQPVWEGITTEIAAPRLGWPLRLLQALGVPYPDLVVLRASASIQLSWALAMLGAILFAFLSGSMTTSHQELFYAAVAPLLPAILVAGAYDASDPTRELVASTPFSKLRIALLRTGLAVAAALPMMILMSAVVPGLSGHRGAWLLPSLTLTVVALTLLTWWTAPVTVGAVSAGWILLVAVWAEQGSLAAADTAVAQAAFAAVALVAVLALAERFSYVRVPGGRA